MKETMKAVIKHHRGVGLELAQVPIPHIGQRDVLIKIKAASICGSDIPIYDWDDPWVRSTILPGQIIGHEFCGFAVERGQEVHEIDVGDFVTSEGHLNCGRCSRCKNGEGHICPNLKLVGFDRPGGFAEYISVPASNVVKLHDLPVVIAAIQDPFGNAIHASTRVSLAGSTVLITGCGPIGLMSIGLAKLFGARRIFATDISDFRLRLASKLGADLPLNPKRDDLSKWIKEEIADDNGVDTLLEMSGSNTALKQGFGSLRNGGQAILLGLPKSPTEFDFSNDLITKCITVYGITGRQMFKTWDQASKLLRPGGNSMMSNLMSIITHRLLLDDFERGIELMRSGECGKVILFMDEDSLQQSYQ